MHRVSWLKVTSTKRGHYCNFSVCSIAASKNSCHNPTSEPTTRWLRRRFSRNTKIFLPPPKLIVKSNMSSWHVVCPHLAFTSFWLRYVRSAAFFHAKYYMGQKIVVAEEIGIRKFSHLPDCISRESCHLAKWAINWMLIQRKICSIYRRTSHLLVQ